MNLAGEMHADIYSSAAGKKLYPITGRERRNPGGNPKRQPGFAANDSLLNSVQ